MLDPITRANLPQLTLTELRAHRDRSHAVEHAGIASYSGTRFLEALNRLVDEMERAGAETAGDLDERAIDTFWREALR